MIRIILTIYLLLTINCLGYSQIAINSDQSEADNNAVLDIKSTAKGLLLTRLTTDQIEAIANPPDGLIVFCTTDKKIYCFHDGDNEWKQLDLGTSILKPYFFNMDTTPTWTYEVGSYYAGINTTAANLWGKSAYFYDTGYYHVYTDTINGYSFSGMGTANAIGNQGVTLYPSGTPMDAQTDLFIATGPGGKGNFTFSIVVNPAPCYPSGTVHCIADSTQIQDVFNPVTGRIWLDRNLGASQVADSSTDINSYGDLYQWGRFSDGHQCRTSSTTTTLSTTNTPGHNSFIITNTTPNDWLTPQNNGLWQGINGINNPCPDSYKIATRAEWEAEIATWTSSDSFGAFSSVLKLPKSGSRGYYGINYEGIRGMYWTSSVISTGTYRISILDSSLNSTSGGGRTNGYSVRCIKY